MTVYRVHHVTSYAYAEPVLLAHHQAHLMPRNFDGQTCRQSRLSISPACASLDDGGQDCYGNPVTFFTIEEPHASLVVEATSLVEVSAPVVPAAEQTPPWDQVAAAIAVAPRPPAGAGDGATMAAMPLEAADFSFDSPLIVLNDDIAAYARPSFPAGRPLLAALLDLNQRLHADFVYHPGATSVATPLTQVLAERRGVCQDFAHLGIACLRAMGLSARYVSGYLLTRPPPGQEKLRGSDASHAWFSAFVPGSGWIDLDPTNDCLPGAEHVTLAWGRDYDDVSPLRGVVLGGGEHSLKVSVDVEPASA